MTHHDAPGTSRRTVLRTGATLAWSAPVVLAVSAAPAYAASGDTTLQVVLSQPVRLLNSSVPPTRTELVVSSTVTNTGDVATRALQVVLRVSAASAPNPLDQSTASDVAGFASPVRSSVGGGQQVFFTYVATEQLGPRSSIVFNPTVSMQSDTDGALNVSAMPGNGPADDMSLPFQ